MRYVRWLIRRFKIEKQGGGDLGEDLVDADITGGCHGFVVEQFYSDRLSHELTQFCRSRGDMFCHK